MGVFTMDGPCFFATDYTDLTRTIPCEVTRLLFFFATDYTDLTRTMLGKWAEQGQDVTKYKKVRETSVGIRGNQLTANIKSVRRLWQ